MRDPVVRTELYKPSALLKRFLGMKYHCSLVPNPISAAIDSKKCLPLLMSDALVEKATLSCSFLANGDETERGVFLRKKKKKKKATQRGEMQPLLYSSTHATTQAGVHGAAWVLLSYSRAALCAIHIVEQASPSESDRRDRIQQQILLSWLERPKKPKRKQVRYPWHLV
jgi:hypothetical protein